MIVYWPTGRISVYHDQTQQDINRTISQVSRLMKPDQRVLLHVRVKEYPGLHKVHHGL